MIKEEKTIPIRLLASNADEIIETLNAIEKEYGVESALAFCDELIELLKMGEQLSRESILKYYDIYFKTFCFASQRLSDAILAVKYSTIDSIKDIYQFLPWYKKLWINIVYWLKRKKLIK
jgi:hypothetical protein